MNKLNRKICFPVLLLFVFIAAAFCDGRTALADNKNKNSANQPLETQNKRLDEFEKIVSGRKKLIEKNFAFHVRSLQDRETDYLHRLERLSYKLSFNKKRILIEFIEAYTDLLFTENHLMSDRYYSSATDSFFTHRNISHKLSSVLRKPRPGSYKEKMARKFLKDMQAFQDELRKLERRRDTPLIQLAKWEKYQRENISKTIRTSGNSAEKPDFGVILAIGYEKENPFIMINDKIVYQEHSIDNVKIVRIEPEKVEFKKKAKSWIQNIGAPANDYWKK